MLPYIHIPPDGPASPLLVSVPHAGTRIPEQDRELIVCDRRTMLRDADLLVDRLYRSAPELGAGLIAATISRYVLDVNRAPGDVDRQVCHELDSPAAPNPRALIWRLSTEAHTVLPRTLSRAELDSRIARVHTPYHAKVRALLDARVQRFGYAILLDGHSMPSVGRATHSDPGVRRADVVPGDNKGRSCHPSLLQLVAEHFEAAGLSVLPNKPYSGGWITRNYGQPADNVHAIQIELNRDLYLYEDAPQWKGAEARPLQRTIDRLLRKLVSFNPTAG